VILSALLGVMLFMGKQAGLHDSQFLRTPQNVALGGHETRSHEATGKNLNVFDEVGDDGVVDTNLLSVCCCCCGSLLPPNTDDII
jgi:hypothetical protein